MSINKQDFSDYIKNAKFRELFNEMGWNNDKTNQPIIVDNITFSLQAVAEKSGFKILLCNPTESGLIPDYNTRKKIETKVTKLFQEHLIIFFDAKKQEQIWQLTVRQSGKPTKVTETRFHITQNPELLYQRASGIFFEMDEEEKITIVDVKSRMAENFHANSEKVTKQFYEKFKKEHTSFLGFIEGIDDKVSKDWYASLMLNRLMFCYFIQKKGFLDNKKDYLRDKLTECQLKKGNNKFYSFYRDFLLVLFHQGLNEAKQKAEIKNEIGAIPYLNGGLFDEHELEKIYKTIDIEDKAFERIFIFFDEWEWHLDTRIIASGRDINPDVIGYIFEKYINDRANMGAYYTKEDITDYISKNCILPYLFDETKRQYPKAFLNDGEIWQAVNQSNDKYIYDAVKKGCEEVLPPEIAVGIKDVAKRTEWNKPAPLNFALPTEIWREVVDRRNRYTEIKNKLEKAEITTINDFITYNLNIRQFAQDTIENTNDPEFLKCFYKSLSNVTIIDPTCGSGAFLFAAMNILEPLYEASIMRMRAFVEDEDRINEAEKKSFSNKFKFFRSLLEDIQNEHHPNLKYYIFKSIILRNLYGVDIMNEAVEIAKLRLFLKLVATVEVDFHKPNLGLEPLPDIDFNIRAGNTLVGFANEAELKYGLSYTLDGIVAKPVIEEKCDIVARTFTRYKEIQLGDGVDYKEFKNAKEELNKRLIELNQELNLLLHKQTPAIKYDTWLKNHQPFHWFAEYYEIIHDKGGFDVVIGNPPYVEYSEVKNTYSLKGFDLVQTGNLFSICVERFYQISKINDSRFGVIIPISSVSTIRMNPLMKFLIRHSRNLHTSNFAVRPGKLFSGADMNVTIILAKKELKMSKCDIFSTIYNRWYEEIRTHLFECLSYTNSDFLKDENSILKLGSPIENTIFSKIKGFKKLNTLRDNSHKASAVFYHSGGRYWRKCILQKLSNEYKEFAIISGREEIVISLISSSLYYWYWLCISDCYHVTKEDINSFYYPETVIIDKRIPVIANELLKDLERNKVVIDRKRKDGTINQEVNYFVGISKPIIDQIDTVLAEHYGFTAEELDFIINYDIKYRMGKELEVEEE